MGSALGVAKTAAQRLGLSFEEYSARVSAGLKWCRACREWHPRSAFGRDRHRTDGLSSVCSDSRIRAVNRPGARERRIKAALGLAWCRDCRAWLAAQEVTQGVCRTHRNEYARSYYARNCVVIRSRKRARDRGLDPIPLWWQEDALAEFGGLCAYGCGHLAATFDHIYPVSRGGKSRPSNLVPACKSCNSKKKAQLPGPWIDKGLLAFPDQWEHLIALDFEHAGYLDLEY